ncbi:hypothetical protein V493_07902, partial [Pseudogymnoascus sp. VKM F-4281 (FW-2241)]
PWSRAGVLLQLIYTTLNLFCVGFRVSTISGAGLRAGSLAVVNMIPLFAGAHLAFFADQLGVSLKTIRAVHRSVGFMAFSLGLFHVLVIVASNVPFPLNESRNLFAVIGGSLLCLLVLLVCPLFRKLSYELFLRTHQALAVASAYAVWRHLPSEKTFPRLYIYVSAGLLLSMFLLQCSNVIFRNRIFWGHLSRATITHDSGAVKIRLHLQKPLKVDDGQYVNLWIPSVSFWSFLQSHPFMVVSWEPKEQHTLDLLIEPQRGLTQELLYHAKKDHAISPIVMLNGPHGPRVAMDEYESILMVASGFGIAAHLPHLKRLIYGYNVRLVRARRIHLIWQIRNKADGLAAQSLLNSALDEDKLDDGCILEVSVYLEHSESPKFPFGNRATAYPGSAPLLEIFLAEVSGKCIKRPRMERADNSGKSLVKREPDTPRPDRDLESAISEEAARDGKMLVTVSGSEKIRDQLRMIVRKHLQVGVSLLELEY